MSTDTTEQPATFGARLAAARRAKGLTQEQLAEGMGPDGRALGKGAVSAWEVDRGQPSAAQLTKICQRLGVTADHLLGLPAQTGEAA